MNALIPLGLVVLMIALPFRTSAAETTPGMEDAVSRGLARVTGAATNWQKNKTCFSCHHQTLPMLAMTASARAGLPTDAAWLQSQTDTTHRYFEQRIGEMDEGEHVPGGAATTGFGFWALSLGERPADKTTTAMVAYLLQIQGVSRLSDRKPDSAPKPEDGRWQASCRRAPMQASFIGDTVLVLIGLEKYATPDQRPRVAKAREAAERWLAQTPLRDQQDRLWRLWGLHHLGGDDTLKQRTREAILAAQRDDGGWAEDKARQSDAYSTGQTLFMLCKTGTARDHAAAWRARDYLLRTQLADGSWLTESHVKTKAQPYFENGDPHGEHQFLSTAATAWATAALAQLLPPK